MLQKDYQIVCSSFIYKTQPYSFFLFFVRLTLNQCFKNRITVLHYEGAVDWTSFLNNRITHHNRNKF